jgi:hypothetical protein
MFLGLDTVHCHVEASLPSPHAHAHDTENNTTHNYSIQSSTLLAETSYDGLRRLREILWIFGIGAAAFGR